MPRAEGVVRAFKAVAKSADSSGLAEIAEFFVISAGKKLVGIALVRYVKKYLVFRRVKNPVESY